MIWFFLSVAAVCASALAGFRMYINSKPVQQKTFDALEAAVVKLENRVNKLSMGKIGA
jgi:hypothetical protein